jgi:glycosyltransferase involved in cell wall biosynthesis
VVPLRSGAGVKFKTIDAMLSGVPVVTTSVGAEGIDAVDLFVAVTDTAADFAIATINELQQPDSTKTTRAQARAEQVYGESAFEQRLSEVYERVWSN